MADVTTAQLFEALRELSGVEPVVTVEPAHIQAWSLEMTPMGVRKVSPPELERVTITYSNDRHTLSAVVYDRERDIVRAFEMAELFNWKGD